MTDTSEREYTITMLERLETTKNYLGSVVNRTIGRAAWMEAMQQPNESYAYSYTNTQPTWARYLNRALYQGAPIFAGLQLLAPFAFSEQFGKFSFSFTPAEYEKNPYALFGEIIGVIAAEGVLWLPTIALANNLGEAVGLKLATNAVVHMGLDAATAVANMVKKRRPSGTTLAG